MSFPVENGRIVTQAGFWPDPLSDLIINAHPSRHAVPATSLGPGLWSGRILPKGEQSTYPEVEDSASATSNEVSTLRGKPGKRLEVAKKRRLVRPANRSNYTSLDITMAPRR